MGSPQPGPGRGDRGCLFAPTASCRCWVCHTRGTLKGLFGAWGIFMKHEDPTELRWTRFERMLLGEAVSPKTGPPLINSPKHTEGSPKVPLHPHAAGPSGGWATSPPHPAVLKALQELWELVSGPKPLAPTLPSQIRSCQRRCPPGGRLGEQVSAAPSAHPPSTRTPSPQG